MTEKEPIEHDDVMSSLLDLQRRLRDADTDKATGDSGGERPAPTIVAARPMHDRTGEVVEVRAHDLSVLMTPVLEPERADQHIRDRAGAPPPERFAPVTQLPTASSGEDRVTALSERLSRLEQELSGVLGSLDSMRGRVTAEVTAGVAERMIAVQHETDERTIQLVGDRMNAVTTRLTEELATQRRDLAGLLERRIGDMEASLRDAIHEVAGEPEDVTPAD